MYAIVKKQDGTFYTSYVFAHYYEKADVSKHTYKKYIDCIYSQFYVVLNQEKTELIKQHVFYRSNKYLEPQIHIVEHNTDDWVSIRKNYSCIDVLKSIDLLSYDWNIESDVLEKCIEIDKQASYNEYVDIKTQNDIDNFMFATGHMHDAFIEEIKQEGDMLYVLFGGCWGLKVEMWFTGDLSYSVASRNPDEFDPDWFGATLIKENEHYYLVDEEDMSVDEITNDFCWFKAKSVRYHLIPQ